MNYFQTPLIPGHDPFESRKTLVAISVVLAIGFGVVFGDFLWGAAFYVVFVTVGDLLSPVSSIREGGASRCVWSELTKLTELTKLYLYERNRKG